MKTVFPLTHDVDAPAPLRCFISLFQIAGLKYGYSRASTDDQNPALQIAALKKAEVRAHL